MAHEGRVAPSSVAKGLATCGWTMLKDESGKEVRNSP